MKTTLTGRYELGELIATGGMAEIYLARQSGFASFERTAVVKLLKPTFRTDPRVVEMFLDEGRIGAALHHPHIVHVYDVGEVDLAPFIAMEHIDGEELSTLCRRGLELGNFLPVEHAVDLVRQAAEGMGYFHSRRGNDGEPLEIVHRDISPSNLLVTRDGHLKIIDFGIARSSRSQNVDESILPGKYNYMSPEQVRGETIDHRSDIFSLGVVLYEITVAKRLFKGKPDEVIQKITKERIQPPTFVRRDFPPPLEAIVLKALEAHPGDRYQSAYELAADLEDFLRAAGYRSGPVRIARYLDALGTTGGDEPRPELVIAGEAWVDDAAEDALDFGRSFAAVAEPPKPAPRIATPKPEPKLEPVAVPAAAPRTATPRPPFGAAIAERPPPSAAGKIMITLIIGVLLGALAAIAVLKGLA